MAAAWMAPPVHAGQRGVYVHFPYCAQKCPYCDFNSHATAHDDAAYRAAILSELAARGDELGPGPLRSIYFGGGTPSRWAPSEVGRVIRALLDRYGAAPDLEITLEANPGTVTEDRLGAFVDAGVNRFSIGVQSLRDPELTALGRIHDGETARRAVRAAVATGARVSLDLIYGLPEQRWAEVEVSLDGALALGTHHVSAYTLTIEPDSTLGRRTKLGLFTPMDDDRQAELIERVTEVLEGAGLRRYEVSSYARPGFEAVHNSLYWVGAPYLGLGAGAHSFRTAPDLSFGVRRENVRPPERYLASAAAGRVEASFEEHQSADEVLADRLWTGLRARWGLDLAALEAACGRNGLAEALEPALGPLVRDGLLRREGARVGPTDRGFLFTDHIGRTLLGAARALDTAKAAERR